MCGVGVSVLDDLGYMQCGGHDGSSLISTVLKGKVNLNLFLYYPYCFCLRY